MFNLGMSEMILIGIIALIFIGPKQLPEIARTIGRMLNEFKRATEDITTSITDPKAYSKKKEFDEEHERFLKRSREQEEKLITEAKEPPQKTQEFTEHQHNDPDHKDSES
jgi:sec-independent protein translocase protein TatB